MVLYILAWALALFVSTCRAVRRPLNREANESASRFFMPQYNRVGSIRLVGGNDRMGTWMTFDANMSPCKQRMHHETNAFLCILSSLSS